MTTDYLNLCHTLLAKANETDCKTYTDLLVKQLITKLDTSSDNYSSHRLPNACAGWLIDELVKYMTANWTTVDSLTRTIQPERWAEIDLSDATKESLKRLDYPQEAAKR